MNKDPQSSPSVPFDELRRVVRLMKENDLSFFQFEREGFRLKLRRGPEPGAVAAPATATPGVAPPVPAAQPSEGEDVPSPMVGTFYRAAAPNDPPFVNPGDTVTLGQTLCIIEAMKVMNEIKAERGGLVTAVLAEDGAAVQFGQVLMRIK